MSDDAEEPVTLLRPGFASEEPEESETVPIPTSRIEAAHYTGMTEEAAAETFKEESLCMQCHAAMVCKIADGADAPLAVVSRCLAFIPRAG